MSLATLDATAHAVLPVLADAAVRGLLLAAIAWVMLTIARVNRPPVQLRVWTFVLYAALMMPIAAALLPAIPLPLPLFVLAPASAPPDAWIASARASQNTAGPLAPAFPSAALLLAAYLLGAGWLALRGARGWLAALRLERGCQAITDAVALERIALQASALGRRSRCPAARVRRSRRAGDDVRVAAGGGPACRLARVAGRDARCGTRARAVARRAARFTDRSPGPRVPRALAGRTRSRGGCDAGCRISPKRPATPPRSRAASNRCATRKSCSTSSSSFAGVRVASPGTRRWRAARRPSGASCVCSNGKGAAPCRCPDQPPPSSSSWRSSSRRSRRLSAPPPFRRRCRRPRS